LICVDLSASCGHCKEMDIKMDTPACPQCKAEFKYIAFRNIRENMPKIHKLSESSPHLTVVDFDDFKRLSGALKAEKFLK